MKLTPIYSTEVCKALNTLDTMIQNRKRQIDEVIKSDKELTFLYGNLHIRKSYYAEDYQVRQLTEERNRIISIVIPEDYEWSK